MVRVHPSEVHEMVLAYGVVPGEARVVQGENHQVHHALEAHSNPVAVHAKGDLGTFAVYAASDPVHPAHLVLAHSSSVAHSIDLDFGIVVDLAVEVRFLDALVDPAVLVALPVLVDLPYASVPALDDYGVVAYPAAYSGPFPFVVDHPVHWVLPEVHPSGLPDPLGPYPCSAPEALVARWSDPAPVESVSSFVDSQTGSKLVLSAM